MYVSDFYFSRVGVGGTGREEEILLMMLDANPCHEKGILLS